MRKERRIEIRVGVPAFFALELEGVYRHTEGAHRALAFPNFVGLLVGLGMEAYRKGNATAPIGKDEAPDEGSEKAIPLFDLDPKSLPDLFRDFDRATAPRKEKEEAGFKFIYPEDWND
jgi:hypothetical protein